MVRLAAGRAGYLLPQVHDFAVLVHDSPLREGFLALGTGGGQPADGRMVRVNGVRFFTLSALGQARGVVDDCITRMLCSGFGGIKTNES